MTADPEILVPDPAALAAVQLIGDLRDPYATPPGYGGLFARAMREVVAWHAARTPFYADVLARQGFTPAEVETPADCARIPWIPAAFFKTHEVLSVPRQDIALHLTSSGTSGQRSQMFFDRWSLRCGQRMVDSMFTAGGFVTPDTPTNYLLYSYETAADNTLGTAYTDNYLCQYAPGHRAFCALRRTGTGTHDFDVFGCIERLREFAAAGLPVRIFGFPAFLYFTLERMRALKLPPLALSPQSLVFLGGGWKGHADRAVGKAELYGMITDSLGIPDARIRDSFGAVEHGVPYVECVEHRFHVPVWSHVIIRDVRTLAPCEAGERGFLQFVTPFITSVPAHSLVMGDLASLHPGSDCGCGIARPYFVVHGRAGTTKNRSCAVAAAELMGR